MYNTPSFLGHGCQEQPSPSHSRPKIHLIVNLPHVSVQQVPSLLQHLSNSVVARHDGCSWKLGWMQLVSVEIMALRLGARRLDKATTITVQFDPHPLHMHDLHSCRLPHMNVETICPNICMACLCRVCPANCRLVSMQRESFPSGSSHGKLVYAMNGVMALCLVIEYIT